MIAVTPTFDASVEQTITALRRNYSDAVRLSVREELLAELAEEAVTAKLYADTARFHHGSARAYARTLELLVGDEFDLFGDKEQVRHATREADLAPMRCQGRRYRAARTVIVIDTSQAAGRSVGGPPER